MPLPIAFSDPSTQRQSEGMGGLYRVRSFTRKQRVYGVSEKRSTIYGRRKSWKRKKENERRRRKRELQSVRCKGISIRQSDKKKRADRFESSMMMVDGGPLTAPTTSKDHDRSARLKNRYPNHSIRRRGCVR